MVACASIPASGENTQRLHACQGTRPTRKTLKSMVSEGRRGGSNDGMSLPFRSTTCARTTLPAFWPHSTLAIRSSPRSAKHRAPFTPTMRSRHRIVSSEACEDALDSSATARWALSALHGAPVCALSTNVPAFRGVGTPSTSDGVEGIDHIPLSPRTRVYI